MILIYIISALFGLFVGSFLNVLILRLPKGKKITGRSFCPHCKRKLVWYDLIPVLSYVLLRAKCRYCQKKISFQYPLIEILTSAFFVLIALQIKEMFLAQGLFGVFFHFIFWLFFISVLIVIFTTDFKYYIVPDKIIYPAIFMAFLYQVINSLIATKPLILNAFLSGLGAALFFLALVLITKGKGMGLGDVKIAAFMGLLLSFPNIFVALFLAFLVGSIVGFFIVFSRKKNLKKTLKSEVPLGCFLAPATLIAFFWGSQLIDFYWIFVGRLGLY